jgi:hypothetical protein
MAATQAPLKHIETSLPGSFDVPTVANYWCGFCLAIALEVMFLINCLCLIFPTISLTFFF